MVPIVVAGSEGPERPGDQTDGPQRNAEHCEQLEYTCKHVKNVTNAKLTC